MEFTFCLSYIRLNGQLANLIQHCWKLLFITLCIALVKLQLICCRVASPAAVPATDCLALGVLVSVLVLVLESAPVCILVCSDLDLAGRGWAQNTNRSQTTARESLKNRK